MLELSGKGRKVKAYFYRPPDYGLLPASFLCASGYLGGEDFMVYEENMTYFTSK